LTTLDWVIVGFTVLMAGWGYLQGLLVGGLSLAGFVGGALLGSRVGPLLLEDGSASPYAPLAALVGALLVGGLLASGLETLGFHLRHRLGSRLGVLDGLGGSMLVGCLGLVVVWIVGAVALHTPGATDLRKPIQKSEILRRLNAVLPPSGPLLKALARFDPFPRITGPVPRVAPPNSAIARDPQVRAASRSVVKVVGTACGLGVQGSGWVAGQGIVVTNAHVVAGQDDTSVQVGGVGDRHDAEAVFFDSRNDVAVLRSSGIAGTPALGMNPNAGVGTSAAVLGFPNNGSYTVQPARLGPTQTFLSQDAYGRGPVRRRVTSVRSDVRPGNSGGPAVDGNGRVLTTIFARARLSGAGFGVPDSIAQDALRQAGGSVDTGPCVR
jgi:S1-C subfamily serine protease